MQIEFEDFPISIIENLINCEYFLWISQHQGYPHGGNKHFYLYIMNNFFYLFI